MEWLKEILEKAAVTEDGKLDVAAVMKTISAEFPKHAVPKSDFNTKAAELKAANDAVAELKKSNGDNEALQKKIGEYEEKVKTLTAEAENTKKSYALKEQLAKAGITDPDYLIYKHGGIEKFTFDKENQPVGVTDLLKTYKEDSAMSHLFKEETKKQPYTPESGGAGNTKNPFMKESYNMTEQARLLRSSPEQARAMAAAAGVTIGATI
ncbi:MAG: hypothetical protein HFI75_02575 [Lachnospiraceae bacterium]|nr:hypothetical protein [Lachnospiraceae bacterium]